MRRADKRHTAGPAAMYKSAKRMLCSRILAEALWLAWSSAHPQPFVAEALCILGGDRLHAVQCSSATLVTYHPTPTRAGDGKKATSMVQSQRKSYSLQDSWTQLHSQYILHCEPPVTYLLGNACYVLSFRIGQNHAAGCRWAAYAHTARGCSCHILPGFGAQSSVLAPATNCSDSPASLYLLLAYTLVVLLCVSLHNTDYP